MTDRKTTGPEQAESNLSAEDLDQVVGGRGNPSIGEVSPKQEDFQKRTLDRAGKGGVKQEDAEKRSGS